jgi:SAM-dependent methyltransferase
MGQGRNAVYLATKGWKVTGVDISKEGVRQAVEAAAKQKKKLTGIVDNVETWDIGTGKWDLITMIYAGADETLIARAQKGVKKGGLFVTEYFHSDAGKGIGIGGYSTGQLAGLFANGWKIITDEVVEDTADFSLRKMKLVRFTAQKL